MYVYILLIAAIVSVLVLLVIKILDFLKHLKELTPQFDNIGKNANALSAKADRIGQSKDSYSFLLAVLAIFGFADDIRKYKKKDYSLADSIAVAAMKNSGSLKKLKR